VRGIGSRLTGAPSARGLSASAFAVAGEPLVPPRRCGEDSRIDGGGDQAYAAGFAPCAGGTSRHAPPRERVAVVNVRAVGHSPGWGAGAAVLRPLPTTAAAAGWAAGATRAAHGRRRSHPGSPSHREAGSPAVSSGAGEDRFRRCRPGEVWGRPSPCREEAR